jgi:hypothetical protein
MKSLQQLLVKKVKLYGTIIVQVAHPMTNYNNKI